MSKEKEIVMFSARIPTKMQRTMKMDAAKFSTTINSIVLVMFDKFFKEHSPDERRKLYEKASAQSV